jgi:hypothetical protein
MAIASNVDEVLARARSQAGLGIRYKLGGGSARASRHTCADTGGTCDCSAFACWALGVDKQGSYPFLVPAGQPVEPGNQWYGTDNMWNDSVHVALGLFSKIDRPIPGCLILYPAQRLSGKKSTPGHVGIVTKVGAEGAVVVLHCSSGNFRQTGDAIQETDDSAFRGKAGLIFAWYAGVAVPVTRVGPEEMAFSIVRPVVVCVVANGSDGAVITQVARTVAAENPFGRRVVAPGDAGYPSASDIAAWIQGVLAPGAVVLTPGGVPFKVLTVTQARSEMVIDKAFADAAAEG